jgi:hypothetical protein
VALLAATGAINTLLLVGNVDSLAGTPSGRLLSLKILLFSVMVVLALTNRFRLLPRLRREPPSSAPIAALARSVLFEQALSFAVLAVVAFSAPGPQPFTTIADNEAVDRCPAPRRQSGSRGLSAGGRWIRTIGPWHETADFCCGRRIAGTERGSQSGEPTIPACQSNNAFAPIPAVRGATTAPQGASTARPLPP